MRFISYSSLWRYILSTSKSSMVKNSLITKVGIFDLFLNRSSLSILKYWQLKFFFFVKRGMAISQRTFLYFGCYFRIRRRQNISIIHHAFIIWSCLFWYTIFKHCMWIMLICNVFINEGGHIKNLKIITRAVYFGIPTLEIFLNKKRLRRTVGII